jgi:hypothetical protein
MEGAHEKGGVKAEIGYLRRNHFVPVPEVSSLAELNEMVEQWDRQDDARRIDARSRTIAEDFALEQPPLPEKPFETGWLFPPRVDRYGQVPVRTHRSSVHIRLIGKRVRVILHASHLVVYVHDALWTQAMKIHGERDGTRADKGAATRTPHGARACRRQPAVQDH